MDFPDCTVAMHSDIQSSDSAFILVQSATTLLALCPDIVWIPLAESASGLGLFYYDVTRSGLSQFYYIV